MKLFLPLHDWIPDFAGDGFCPRSRSAFLLPAISALRASARHWCGQPQPLNPFQHGPEQLPRDRHLRHLEDHLPGMAHDLRPDLISFSRNVVNVQ